MPFQLVNDSTIDGERRAASTKKTMDERRDADHEGQDELVAAAESMLHAPLAACARQRRPRAPTWTSRAVGA